MEEGEACAEASSVEDDPLFAEEEERADESVGQSLCCEADCSQQKFVEAVVCVQHVLG